MSFSIKALLLKNFRNYKEEVFTFSKKLNLIWGENGQGKTNLLEAIFLLCTGRSFRTAKFSELIAHGQEYFYLEARIEKDSLSQIVKIYFNGQLKKISINGTTFPAFSSLTGIFPAVLLAPNDAHLIEGLPAERRRFLNIHLAQQDPLYGYHLTRFTKALKQRNCLLRSDNIEAMDAWENEMSTSAFYLMKKRQACVEELKQPLHGFLKRLSSNQDDLMIDYLPSIELKEESSSFLFDFYQQSREKDKLFQMTRFGPHRDDLSFLQNKKKAKSFSSEGQKRTVLLSLKLAEWQRLKEKKDFTPLFCMDDYAIHLDNQRQKSVKEEFMNMEQIFLTSPEKPKEFMNSLTTEIKIKEGRLLSD